VLVACDAFLELEAVGVRSCDHVVVVHVEKPELVVGVRLPRCI
jgi:hypothetical protein